MNFSAILNQYNLNQPKNLISPLGTGLINATWLVTNDTTGTEYVLQKVNEKVFKHPEDIAFNIALTDTYLKENYPDYFFIGPIKTTNNEEMVCDATNGYFRLFPFAKGSKTLTTLQKPAQAYEAAKQFGKFTSLLAGLDATQLKTTIPDFHNLELRFEQFTKAINTAVKKRNITAGAEIVFLLENKHIVDTYKEVRTSPHFKHRVTHHDTKISNILFDKEDKGLCVIDLDTVMPGYFISDVGDMIRTYLAAKDEEDNDYNSIEVRTEFFEAIAHGYLGEMANTLTNMEIKYFVYAGDFIIYMQALRFLTDYLNGDMYYHAKYENHNLVRAKNQVALLRSYQSKKNVFNEIVNNYFVK